MDLSKTIEETQEQDIKEDLTLPIARSGEQQFACIMRNRSGIDAGEIDMGVRVFSIQNLSDYDKQSICDTAYAMYKTICDYTGKQALREEAHSEWIPVSERLPEEGNTVLLYDGQTWTDEITTYALACIKQEEYDNHQNYCNVTHWMPLPEKPKGEVEE